MNSTVSGAAAIISKPLPPMVVWRIISDTARERREWIRANEQLFDRYFEDPAIREWPIRWSEPIDDELTRITRNEALAVLERFLMVNSGGIISGARLHLLQWETLASVYCPRRERHEVLRELVGAGYLRETSDGVTTSDVGLAFPLVVTESCANAIDDLRLRIEAEAGFITRHVLHFEHWWAKKTRQYPALVRLTTAVTTNFARKALWTAIAIGIGVLIAIVA